MYLTGALFGALTGVLVVFLKKGTPFSKTVNVKNFGQELFYYIEEKILFTVTFTNGLL